MPRVARKKSKTGIYHIIHRGNNRQMIFKDDEDRSKFLYKLIDYKEICEYEIYAYCLMGNHMHLVLKEGLEPLEQIMRRIGASYVHWYNSKYERIGNLFQDRFKSEPVNTDAYLKTVIRYVHQNPVKAKIAKDLLDYKWSSYGEYIGSSKNILIDKDYILEMFSENSEKALKEFAAFHNIYKDDKCLEIEEKKKIISDGELVKIIKNTFDIDPKAIKNEEKNIMNDILKKTLEIEGVTTRQLARVTEISPNTIWKL